MRFCFFASFFFIALTSYCQRTINQFAKPPLDTSMLNKLPMMSVLDTKLSNDGKYYVYRIERSIKGSQTLCFSSMDQHWTRSFIGGKDAAFTADSKQAVFMIKDTLNIIDMLNPSRTFINDVEEFKLLEIKNGQSLFYRTKKGELIIKDLILNSVYRVTDVKDCILSPDGEMIYYLIDNKQIGQYEAYAYNIAKKRKMLVYKGDNAVKSVIFAERSNILAYVLTQKKAIDFSYSIHSFNIVKNENQLIYQGKDEPLSGSLSFDQNGHQMLFLTQKAIWYYTDTMLNAVAKITNKTPGFPSDFQLNVDKNVSFSINGQRIVFSLNKPNFVRKTPELHFVSGVNIWSGKDLKLYSAQVADGTAETPSYQCFVNINKDSVIRVERDGEENSVVEGLISGNRFALMQTRQGDSWWWKKGQLSRVFLISLVNGSRRELGTGLKYNQSNLYMLSPKERYVIYYDRSKAGYQCYNIQNDKSSLITRNANVSWGASSSIEGVDPVFGKSMQLVGLCGWINGEDKVLIYDSCRDIWKFDLSERERPSCITNGYAHKYGINFTLFNRESGALVSGGYSADLKNGEYVILQGLKVSTKDLGLYRLQLGGKKSPQLIIKGRFANGSGTMLLAKARDHDVYLLRSSSYDDAPNLFAMENHQSIRRLTNFQPQRNYRWYRTELVNWKLRNGEKCQGILYIPEGMDTKEKHPLIFNYYETHSDDLNRFLQPEWMNADLNVPYFTSRGYLVFKPDIHAKVGHPGNGALETIETAARYLTKRPYVDSRKLGLMGHSYGGYETNYIITHSHLFAAAVEGAGMSDFVSGYLSVTGKEHPTYWLYENFQNRIGATLWQRPDLYIENSPIFRADRVTTPLLMMQNKLDMNVPWAQGLEFFLALRRLNKDVWMLEYDNEEHQLDRPENKQDFTIRVTQFFDHYLKNALPPLWMTEGIAAKDKGIKTGLALDTSGKKP